MTIPVFIYLILLKPNCQKKKKKKWNNKVIFHTDQNNVRVCPVYIVNTNFYHSYIVYLCMIAGWSEIDKLKQLWWKVCHPYHVTWMGVTQVWFWYGSAAGNLKLAPYIHQISKKKWPIYLPIGPISTKLTWFLPNFLKFEPILAKILDKFTHSYTKYYFA